MKASLILNDSTLLTLIGSFSEDNLQGALRRINSNTVDLNSAIRERGLLITGVFGDQPRISEQDPSGYWRGHNIDFARSIAEELTGSPDRVAFQAVDSIEAAFTQVRSANVDLGLFNSTATISRDLTLGIDFTAPYFIDSQGILVNNEGSIASAGDLQVDDTIGVLEGETTRTQLQIFFDTYSIQAQIQEFASTQELLVAMRTGEIAGISSDRSILFSYQNELPNTHILEETFSQQALAAALPENQSAFASSVTWISQVPIEAERLNISSSNLQSLIDQSQRNQEDTVSINPEVLAFLELGDSQPSSSISQALGFRKGFTQRVIARLGNSAEQWERHFGGYSDTPYNSSGEGGDLRSLPFLAGETVNNQDFNKHEPRRASGTNSRTRLHTNRNRGPPGRSRVLIPRRFRGTSGD